ncbi:RluA family pseudouridine synthase [Mariniblastus sp.]|nr:RluA family pseudouridine synthase [Mariniblastus sp.]
MQPIQTFTIADDKQMVLAALREHLCDAPSWSAVKKILRARRVAIGGVVCVDEGRQLSEGEVVTIWDHPLPPPPTDNDVRITYVDADVIVAEKPSGMVTLRRRSDMNWSWARKNLQPTLDECVPRLIGEHAAGKRGKQRSLQRLPQLFPVHRIDRDTSGLLAFARNQEARTKIIQQFADHAAVRKYFALIPRAIKDQTITSYLIRDRGDGLRGSNSDTSAGEDAGDRAVTHIQTLRRIGGFSELECRLETGRTNQIRIHLAELGHPICGDIKYRGPFGKPPITDRSKIRRLALHAAELRFEHPTSGKPLHFQTSWPADVRRFLDRLESLST